MSRDPVELTEPKRTEARYEFSLRKLGAWLDGALAYRAAVTEVRHGFVVRYHHRDMDPVFVERFFPHREIAALRWGDLRLRRRFARRIQSRLQGVALEPGGYQDLFRTIGYDLDQRAASIVTLKEDGDTLILTYAVHDGEQATRLTPRDRAVLRIAARSRRANCKRRALPRASGR